LRGATKQYREKDCVAILLPCVVHSNSNKIKSQPLPLPYPAALRGVAQRYRGSALRARGLKQKQKNEKIESAMSRGKRLKETF